MGFSIRRDHRLPFALVALVALAACGEQRSAAGVGPSDALGKSFFVGEDLQSPSDDPEFWTRATVIDVGDGADQGLFSSNGASPIARIKWVIQEDLLLARLSYERIVSAEGIGAGAASDVGVVVAAFRIQSHFDDPRTGGRSNPTEEDAADRPWYERRYFRVDWSSNLVTETYDFDLLSTMGLDGVRYTPLAQFVRHPASDDAPHFAFDEGYFDVTTRALAAPGTTDLSRYGAGGQPACLLPLFRAGGTNPEGNCNPTELTIRHSFRRVVDRDYEPRDWDGHRFRAFGAFTVQRYGFSRNYGLTDTQRRWLISRYNLWQRSHAYDDPEAMGGPVECYTPAATPAGADPDRDLDGNGTADECEAVTERTGFAGSRCDSLTQKCTLPFRARTAVPQVWFYSTGSSPDFFEPTGWATHEWDVALRSAVQAARYAECVRTADEPDCGARYPVWHGQMDDAEDAVALAREVDDCRSGQAYAGQDCQALADVLGGRRGYTAGVIATAKLPELVILCHSPVQADDPEACGGPRLPAGMAAEACVRADEAGDAATLAACRAAKNARRGDLRYHLVTAITEPRSDSPWGIMADGSDPLTGEKVSASIDVWTHVNDLWSQRAVDLSRYLRGELATDDVTEAGYVHDWAKAAEAATRNGSLPPLTADALERRLAAGVGQDVAALREAKARFERADPALRRQVDETARALVSVRAHADAPATMPLVYRARREKARGTPLEMALTTPMMRQLAGVDETETELSRELASPLRGNDPTLAEALRHLREEAIAARGGCRLDEAEAPLAIADLTNLLEDKFGGFDAGNSATAQLARAERMRRYLARRVHYSVVSHGLGHSVGLRHNFVGSSDAFGYRPQYWQLRTENGARSARCQTPGTDAEGLQPDGACVGPRFFDPVTPEERENLISMWMQGTTMDAPGETTQHLLGLGVYDFAAARMFYGETLSVFEDPSYRKEQPRGEGMLAKLDHFGGTLGLRPSIRGADGGMETLHYSDYQREFELIRDCRPVDPADFRPARWNDDRDGAFHPLLDGHLVRVDGAHTRCRQQPVDYVSYPAMASIGRNAFGDPAGKTHDAAGRVRVPYGFGTDAWADRGNVSVYRHDNGADIYELFDFLITQQEVGHIFTNYSRGRASFGVRSAAGPAMAFGAKLRDGAKGLGLVANVYRDLADEHQYDFNALWALLGPVYFRENLLASTFAFDHLTRILQRPEAGPHFLPTLGAGPLAPPAPDGVWRSTLDADDAPDDGEEGPNLLVPNGATGRFGNVSWGGRPVENCFSSEDSEYGRDYTVNAGAYYEKAFTAILLTESVDDFIADSRHDLDPRCRSVSFADLFPDGYRRWLANNLTGDDAVKGPRIATRPDGSGALVPDVDEEHYPVGGIGWTSWTPPEGPQACFAHEASLLCTDTPDETIVLDPQIGREQQKFLIAWTLQYLPENQQQTWLNQMYLWEVGADTDPGFESRIELHDPNGRIYVAKTFGRETVFGKSVQRGIAARVLEYANELLVQAYRTTPGPDLDGDGAPDWHELQPGPGGTPIVRFDPVVAGDAAATEHCNETDESGCTCDANTACLALQRYLEVPFFLRQAMDAYDLADPSMRGLY